VECGKVGKFSPRKSIGEKGEGEGTGLTYNHNVNNNPGDSPRFSLTVRSVVTEHVSRAEQQAILALSGLKTCTDPDCIYCSLRCEDFHVFQIMERSLIEKATC
jgi:hypothetical protein